MGDLFLFAPSDLMRNNPPVVAGGRITAHPRWSRVRRKWVQPEASQNPPALDSWVWEARQETTQSGSFEACRAARPRAPRSRPRWRFGGSSVPYCEPSGGRSNYKKLVRPDRLLDASRPSYQRCTLRRQDGREVSEGVPTA